MTGLPNVVHFLFISMGLDQDYWATFHTSSALPFPVGLLKKENTTLSEFQHNQAIKNNLGLLICFTKGDIL